MQFFADKGVRTTTSNREAVRDADLVVYAVKPWILPEVVAGTAPLIDTARQEVAAIVATVSTADLRKLFEDAGRRIVRGSIVMPNTAMDVRRSLTFLVEAGTQPSELAPAFFALSGTVMPIAEKTLPAAMALASCGIAFAMRYVRAAMEGGVELGVRGSEAMKMVMAAMGGACALLSREGAHPEPEIDKVTTPGGITIRGLNAMEEAGFTAAVIAGLRATGYK